MTEHEQTPSSAEIVIIDDTPANLHILTEILDKAGYQVRGFPDGAFALRSITGTLPDLILLDIRMPEMDGYAVCARLKADARTCQIPVIFISALDDIRDKVKGFAEGGVDYITKPFQPEEVLARVRTHLMLRSLHTQLMRQNTQLTQEIARRTQAEAELRVLNTQLQQANQQQEETNRHLEALNQELQEANASKDKFFAIIAHDLRNPFTSLLGLTEVLVEEFEHYETASLKKIIAQLYTSSKQVYALLSNLLTWSRLKRGAMHAEPEQFRVFDLVVRNVRLITPQAEQKQLAVSVSGPEDLTVFADLHMLDTVLRNLISNAVKFTHSGGRIEVTMLQPNHHSVQVSVADTGIGMTPEHLADLFRIDARSSQPGTAGEQGTGLGLIVCRELVENNGGTLRVESQPGAGSRFLVTIPSRRQP